MINTKRGRAIAKIEGGKLDGQIIRIYDANDKKKDNNKCCDKCSKKCHTSKTKCCNLCGGACDESKEYINEYIKKFKESDGKKMTDRQLDKLEEYLTKGIEYVDDKKSNTNDFKVPDDGKLIPLFDNDQDQNERIVVYGPSGSGKSTYVGKIGEQFKEDFPEKNIVLFSNVLEDKAIDKLNPYRVPMDATIILEPIDIDDELSDSLVIFDDVNQERQKDVRDEVLHIRDYLSENGRHLKTHIMSTLHLLNWSMKDSRTILNECTQFTYFIKSCAYRPIRNFMVNIMGIEPKKLKQIMKLNSRWITVNRRYPPCIIYENGIIMISHLNDQD